MAGTTITIKLTPQEYQMLLDALKTQMDALQRTKVAGKVGDAAATITCYVCYSCKDIKTQIFRTHTLLKYISAN